MQRFSRHKTKPIAIETLESRTLLSVNMVVHHGDAANDGENLAETVLTPANVNPTDFGKQFTTPLDGPVFAQPLYVQNVNITRGPSVGVHSVVFVATMHDSLYAIDANSGAILWQDSFLNTTDPTNLTATAGVTTVSIADIGNVGPASQLGILATPAIDVDRGELFLNAETKEIRGSDHHFVQRLWGVNLSDGTSAIAPAVIGDTISNNSYFSYTGYRYVAGPIILGSGNNSHPTAYPNTDGWASAPGGATGPVIAYNALIQMQRTSLMLLNGNVYLAMASNGDDGPYYGWVLGYSESNLSLSAAFVTTPLYEGIVGDREAFTAQGGIWAAGSAIATDGTYLYLTTGNGAFNTDPDNFNAQGFPIDHDYSDALIKLAADPNSNQTKENGNGWGLKVADYFTPSNAGEMNELDLDLGSGGVLLLPDSLTDAAGNPMLMFGGKESRIYLLDRDNLGKFNTSYPSTGNPDPLLYDNALGEYATAGLNATTAGIYSTPAYFDGKVYVGVAKSPALVFDASSFASGTIPPGTTVSPTPLQQTATFGYPGPTFTISANGDSDGIAWAMDFSASDLIAYDAGDLASPIYTSNMVAADSFSPGVKFAVPTVANGMVYLSNTANTLIGYGLRSSYLATDPTFFSAPTNVTVTPVNPGDTNIFWTSQSSLATEFRIDRSTDGTNWTTLGYVENSVTSFDDTSAVAGTQYEYRVAAISGASTTLPPPPPPPTGSVAGDVFNDVNGNTSLDSSETGIKGIKVYIDVNNSGTPDGGDVSTTTDSAGHYSFSALNEGNYTIREVLPSGWKQTSPPGNAAITVSLSAGQAIATKNFGEQLISASGSIAGTVFNDSNGNGTQNSGEGGRSGIVVYSDANNNGKLDGSERNTKTDANGAYTLGGLTAATYHIREVLPGGWKQTAPSSNGALSVTAKSAQAVAGKNFGEELIPTTGSITGTVFNDANGNLKKDSSESGLSGWTVYIDVNNDSKIDNGEQPVLTDKNGNYSLLNLLAGTWIVRAIRPSGWSQTTPKNNLGQHITVTAGKTSSGVLFGERKTG